MYVIVPQYTYVARTKARTSLSEENLVGQNISKPAFPVVLLRLPANSVQRDDSQNNLRGVFHLVVIQRGE